MRFSPQFLDEIRARLPVSRVVSRKVALKKAGREYKGLSPFKAERTPSFFVNDQKGFYHCFASGAHGDIFKFVMETEGLSFPEAVERLAGEAGVPMPKGEPNDATDQTRRDERSRLFDLMEVACRFFQDCLNGPLGQEARRYIERRGLDRATVADFRLGFAPAGRSALKELLAREGFSPREMALSGMVVAGEDIAVPYDRFRNRVTFPIADAKGRTIAFGARALDPDAPAKYLNSPETPLFHKGSVLFNAHRARPLAHERDRLIAVEGYMDVIALAEAGIGECVAPLGTALTEEQVHLLWRMAPVPILCFDGDAAGRRAAFRAVETVLPHLKPGFSVQFAFLPDGLDPDDFVRQQGRDALEDLLRNRTRPLFDVLLEREEQAGGAIITPEARAALETRLKAQVARIGDATVRAHYESELRQTLWERSRRQVREIVRAGGRGRAAGLLRRNNAQLDWRVRERVRLGGQSVRPTEVPAVSPSNELINRAAPVPPREALILRTLLNHPWLIADVAEEVSSLSFSLPGLAQLRDALLSVAAEDKSLDRGSVAAHVTRHGLAKVVALVERAITHKGDKFAEPEADPAAVVTGWRHVVSLHRRDEVRREVDAARRALEEEGSEEAFRRLQELLVLLGRLDGTDALSDETAARRGGCPDDGVGV